MTHIEKLKAADTRYFEQKKHKKPHKGLRCCEGCGRDTRARYCRACVGEGFTWISDDRCRRPLFA